MEVERIGESDTWKYLWSDEFGTYTFMFLSKSNGEPGKIRDLEYRDEITGKNTRVFFGRPDKRTYTWKDNFGAHVVVINCQKIE